MLDIGMKTDRLLHRSSRRRLLPPGSRQHVARRHDARSADTSTAVITPPFT